MAKDKDKNKKNQSIFDVAKEAQPPQLDEVVVYGINKQPQSLTGTEATPLTVAPASGEVKGMSGEAVSGFGFQVSGEQPEGTVGEVQTNGADVTETGATPEPVSADEWRFQNPIDGQVPAQGRRDKRQGTSEQGQSLEAIEDIEGLGEYPETGEGNDPLLGQDGNGGMRDEPEGTSDEDGAEAEYRELMKRTPPSKRRDIIREENNPYKTDEGAGAGSDVRDRVSGDDGQTVDKGEEVSGFGGQVSGVESLESLDSGGQGTGDGGQLTVDGEGTGTGEVGTLKDFGERMSGKGEKGWSPDYKEGQDKAAKDIAGRMDDDKLLENLRVAAQYLDSQPDNDGMRGYYDGLKAEADRRRLQVPDTKAEDAGNGAWPGGSALPEGMAEAAQQVRESIRETENDFNLGLARLEAEIAKLDAKDESIQKRKARSRKATLVVAAVMDGLHALSNLYFTTQYAPSMNIDDSQLMTPRIKKWHDKLAEQSKEVEKQRLKLEERILKLRQEKGKTMSSLYKLSFDMISKEFDAKRKALEAETKAKKDAYYIEYTKGKIKESEYRQKKAKVEAENAETKAKLEQKEKEEKIKTEKARAEELRSRKKANEARADASRAQESLTMERKKHVGENKGGKRKGGGGNGGNKTKTDEQVWAEADRLNIPTQGVDGKPLPKRELEYRIRQIKKQQRG